ncbi:hypothetical protein [Haloarchaeobius iranensis]|uniref:DUF8130 domain-containing protein n=1 Tax=Haloarchaeobius iranensis TaxID=996166 RepID=A0A1G9TLY1_9EURY|nr:hypothetical protein [Haloarchaeobius iranensis]SDM48809.1 hypothetical protein SAMN05192554_10316 [Haloarchaeobius iranensis]
MQRRDALKLLPTTALGGLLAGCTDSLSSGNPTETAGRTATPTATDGRTDADDSSDASRLTVLSVSTDQYVLRLNDLGTGPGIQPTPLSEFDDPERTVVEQAIDGGYETDERPAWLRQFVANTRYVRSDDSYYELEHTLPTSVITADRVDRSQVDSVASYEEYEAAVTHEGVVFSGLARVALDGGFETPYVWPSLDSFLDDYDAVDYRGETVRLTLATVDAAPPYTVTATAVSASEIADGAVWDAKDARPAVREVLREAGEASGVYSLDDPPEGLLAGLDEHDYVYLDGRFYTTYIENREPLPVTLDATADEGKDGPTLRLALRNDADGAVSVTSGAPAPFGVLSLRAADGDRRSLLWTDAYEESDHVHTEGRSVTAVNSIGLATEIEADGTVSRTFQVAPDIESGEYVLDDSVGVSAPSEGEEGTLDYTVRVRVE